MKKLITYVLTLSQTFPANHPRAGEETGFIPKFLGAVNGLPCFHPKRHTIRGNYELWRKRFEKIDKGEAVLSIRKWVGKPYGLGSKLVEVKRLGREDGIGLQKMEFLKLEEDVFAFSCIDGVTPSLLQIAGNDGLSVKDWADWFRDYDLSEPMALIQFTKFRY